MALTKTTEEDRIEVVGPYKALQIRTATVIKEDGTELSRQFFRKTLQCGTIDYKTDVWTDTDVSGESSEVQSIATAVWTTTVKNAYKACLIANKPEAGSD